MERTSGGAHDLESRVWLTRLNAEGAVRDRALESLHELLLKMAYARLATRWEWVPPGAVDELALEAADEALVRVVAHLDDFRGASRFTTWACQFAITEVSVSLRRYRRQRRELPVEPEALVLLAGASSTVERQFEARELLEQIFDAVHHALTPNQRSVVLALAIDGVSPQALADSQKTNTGALYKSLHDARRKLRERLAEHGLTPFDESADIRAA